MMDRIAFGEHDRMKNSVLHPVAEGDPIHHVFRQNRTCRPYRAPTYVWTNTRPALRLAFAITFRPLRALAQQ